MASISSKYIKGLNNDLGISKLSNDTLTDALNINITTDLGYSTYIIENQKGNKLNFTIPDLGIKSKITVQSELSGFITIGATNYVLPAGILTVQDLYDYLITLPQIPDEVQIFIFQDTLIVQEQTPIFFTGVTGLTQTTWVPKLTDLSIIGWGQLGEELILLTCPYTQDDEDPIKNNLQYYGQVWKVPFRPDSDEVIGASYPNLGGSAVLNPIVHLVYNGKLPFTRFHEIYREVECRVENKDTGNVYWTADYTFPKVINAYNPNAQVIEEGLLDWLPDAELPIPILQNVFNGGSWPVGKIQMTYQYVNFDGGSSNYAPFSNTVDLVKDTFSESFQNYKGSQPDINSGKAVQFLVDNLDRRYDFIRVVAIHYEIPNVPKVYLVSEIPINSNSITVTLTGGEALVPLTISEIITSQIPFNRVKSISQKKNRLYAFNVSSEKKKLNFDARAYRFRNIGGNIVTELYKADGTSDFYAFSQIGTIPDSHDAVNPYNDESGTVYGVNGSAGFIAGYTNWLTNFQYKYQADGITLGGSGLNVSYTFGSEIYQGNNIYTPGDPVGVYTAEFAPYINVDSITGDVIQAPGTSQEYPVTSPFNSIKSPYQSVIMKTHARGEVYRYSIVGITTKGEETFAEWIGDIKVPEPSESITDEFYLSRVGVGERLDLKYITINFTINTTALFANNPDIVAFKICAVERKENDKTRISMGAGLAPLDEDKNSGTSYSFGDAAILLEGDTSNADVVPTLSLGVNWVANGWDDISRHFNFGFWNTKFGGDASIRYFHLPIYKSPDVDFLPVNTQNGYFKEIQWYETVDDANEGTIPGYYGWRCRGRRYWQKDTGGSYLSFATYFKYHNPFIPLNTELERVHEITNQQLLGIGDFVTPSFSPYMSGVEYNHITKYVDSGSPPNDPSCSGVGSKALFTEVAQPFNPNQTDPEIGTNDVNFRSYNRILAYCKINFGQYGGPFRANRYSNVYIPKSTVINKSDCLPNQEIKTPGDVFMVNYDCVLSAMHWSTDDAVDSNPFAENRNLATRFRKSDTMLQASLIFPTESSVNTELRTGKHWAKDQNTGVDSDDFAQFLFDEFTYNPVYQQENNLKVSISEPFNANFQEDLPYTVFVSKRKMDNESKDSWRVFPPNDFLTLEGTYGSGTKLVNYTERLIALQERGVSQVSSEEIGTVQDETGAVIQTGTGAVLSRYDYLTKDSGTLHQHSVVTTPFGVHYFDVRLKKYMKLTTEGNMAISDVKGLSAFFRENLKGDILSKDQVLLGKGIHGVYDVVYGRVYMTFEDMYYPIEAYTLNGQPKYSRVPEIKTFTISYNENLQAFESFYSFKPQLFISLGRRLYSALPDGNNAVYTHNLGRFGEYYGEVFPSYIEFIVNADPSSNLTFKTDFLQYWSQCFNSQNIDVPFDTLTSLVLSNDYQSTEASLIPLGDKAKRFERSWRVNWIKDYRTNKRLKPYLRDKYLRIKAEYDNNSGNWFRLHDFNTIITPSYPYEK